MRMGIKSLGRAQCPWVTAFSSAVEKDLRLTLGAVFDVTCLWQASSRLIDRTLWHLLDLFPPLLTIDPQLHVHFIKS